MRYVGIDPATKTGIVALDEKGHVLVAKEITGATGGSAEHRIRTLHDEVCRHLQPDDVTGVEFFALDANDTNKTSSGANWAARTAADRITGNVVISPQPGDVKTWVGVESWIGEKGKKVRKSNKEVKKEIMERVEALYNFKPQTDNIADAFVIAKITYAVTLYKEGNDDVRFFSTEKQRGIIDRLAYPEEHKRKMNEAKKEKAVRKKAKEVKG